MSISLDFHYSDTWADAGYQASPAQWANYNSTQFQQAIYNWVNSVVEQLINQGSPPAYIEIGNEITDGTLWPYGEVGGSYNTPTQWSNLGGLLKPAIQGIKAIGSTANIRYTLGCYSIEGSARAASFAALYKIALLRQFFHMHLDSVAVRARRILDLLDGNFVARFRQFQNLAGKGR